MDFHVNFQGFSYAERLGTFWTTVGFLSSVDIHMISETIRVC